MPWIESLPTDKQMSIVNLLFFKRKCPESLLVIFGFKMEKYVGKYRFCKKFSESNKSAFR